MLIDTVTRMNLHMIVLASRHVVTPPMADFIIALPTDWAEATEDEIEEFDKLLDEMEGDA